MVANRMQALVERSLSS